MKITELREVEIGDGSRTRRRFYLSSDAALDVERAVEVEHGDCDSRTCDVAAALAAGFPMVAAGFLYSGTECRLVGAVLDAHAFNGTLRGRDPRENVYARPEWKEWKAYFRAHSAQCAACGAWTTDQNGPHDVDQCDNCLAPLDWGNR